MSFYRELNQYHTFDYTSFFNEITEQQIMQIINKESLAPLDYLALLSPLAEKHLEIMAQKSHRLTIQQFGKTILLFTPMYLSNFCTNQCVYCGFNKTHSLPRKTLTLAEVELEAQTIAATGLKHILILTGDAPRKASVEYLLACIEILRKYFTSIAIEIFALELEHYRQMVKAGVDMLTIYQETYNEKLYDQIHVKGPKKDYHFRLDAPERACRAGIRAVNIGALLGLDNWRKEAFLTGLHAFYLQEKYPDVEMSISLPRLRPQLGGFEPNFTVTDKNMVHFMAAFRLFMPRAGITISTREKAAFRDRIIRLGVTKMSAGSSTVVGGHALGENDTGQFEIADTRNVAEMSAAIFKLGYQPVFKDWHPL